MINIYNVEFKQIKENTMEAKIYSTSVGDSLVYQSSNMTGYATGKNPLTELPIEISLKIFTNYLQPDDIEVSSRVCTQWNAFVNCKDLLGLWKVNPKKVFGPKQWEEHFGVSLDPKDIPPLSRSINKILKSQCPFSEEGKTVEETHVGPVLIPGSIDGKNPLTLEAFGKLVDSRFPKKFAKDGYGYITPKAKKLGGEGKSQWVLIKSDVLVRYRNRCFDLQLEEIEDKGKEGDYQAANALHAVVCTMSEYARSGGTTPLFNKAWPGTYARCPEKINGHQICVGYFDQSGLRVADYRDIHGIVGPAALRILGTKSLDIGPCKKPWFFGFSTWF